MWLNQWEAKELTGRSLATLHRWRVHGWVKTAVRDRERLYDKTTLLKAADIATSRRGGRRNPVNGGGNNRRGYWNSDHAKCKNGLIPLFSYDRNRPNEAPRNSTSLQPDNP